MTAEMFTLFPGTEPEPTQPWGQHPAYVHHSQTSADAADEIKAHTPRMREKVYTTIKGSLAGLTTEEICTITGMKGDTVRPRIVELASSKPPMIKPAGTRPTKSGRQAQVWVMA